MGKKSKKHFFPILGKWERNSAAVAALEGDGEVICKQAREGYPPPRFLIKQHLALLDEAFGL